MLTRIKIFPVHRNYCHKIKPQVYVVLQSV